MGLAGLLTKIPWLKLLSAVPLLVRTARELMQATHKTPPEEEASDLQQRINRLEENEKKQSELTQQLSEQLQTTAENLRIVSLRLQALFIVTLFALLLAATAVILHFR